jgi:serine/threonine protein phosphatase 1
MIKNNNKIWAIGDIHGCYQELMALYEQLLVGGLNPEKDIVVFIGDYMDRGPDSKKVVDQLIKWHKQYSHWIFLYGNHEDILKNWIEGGQKYEEDMKWSCFLYNGGVQTLKSYNISEPIKSLIPKEHLNFLFNETKVFYETNKYIFVHGGLLPGVTIKDTKYSLKNKENKETITNALLWARDGFIDDDYDWGKKVIFGHTPASKPRWGKFGEPIVMKNKIGIDGAICPGANKNLIAVELPKERFYLQESLKIYNDIEKLIII